MTRGATYSVEDAAKVLTRSRRWVDGQIVTNADDAGRRSFLEVGGLRVPVVRIGGRWAVNADALDAALRGEAVA
ncbi:MAG: hypothetical protein ACLGI3_14230 [Actinomycetes bacterium]